MAFRYADCSDKWRKFKIIGIGISKAKIMHDIGIPPGVYLPSYCQSDNSQCWNLMVNSQAYKFPPDIPFAAKQVISFLNKINLKI